MTASCVFHRSLPAMGTRFSIVVPGLDGPASDDVLETVRECLRRHEQVMSRFDAHSQLVEVNAHAAERPVVVQPALWDILLLCWRHWQRTRGAFDITLHPLARLWREWLGRGAAPPPDTIAATRARTGFQHVIFDEGSRSVRFARPGMSLDLGGFGKGYALEDLARRLAQAGLTCALLSFGESSVTVLGRHPAGHPWPIGISDLFAPGSVRHTFHLTHASLSTSGTSPTNTWGGDEVFGHIISPRDGRPIQGHRTLSVTSFSATDAEVLSTALLAQPAEERNAILAEYPTAAAVEYAHAADSATGPTGPLWRHDC